MDQGRADRHARPRPRGRYWYSRAWIPAALCAIVVVALIPILAHAKSSATATSATATVISLNFDDNLASQYYLGFQHALQPAGVHATFYVNSGTIGAAGELSWSQV